MKWLNLEIDEKSKLFFQEERRIINLLDKKMYLEALDLCTNKILYSEKDEKDIFFGLLQIVLEKIEDISKNLNNEEKIESYNALLNGYLNNIRNIVIEKGYNESLNEIDKIINKIKLKIIDLEIEKQVIDVVNRVLETTNYINLRKKYDLTLEEYIKDIKWNEKEELKDYIETLIESNSYYLFIFITNIIDKENLDNEIIDFIFDSLEKKRDIIIKTSEEIDIYKLKELNIFLIKILENILNKIKEKKSYAPKKINDFLGKLNKELSEIDYTIRIIEEDNKKDFKEIMDNGDEIFLEEALEIFGLHLMPTSKKEIETIYDNLYPKNQINEKPKGRFSKYVNKGREREREIIRLKQAKDKLLSYLIYDSSSLLEPIEGIEGIRKIGEQNDKKGIIFFLLRNIEKSNSKDKDIKEVDFLIKSVKQYYSQLRNSSDLKLGYIAEEIIELIDFIGQSRKKIKNEEIIKKFNELINFLLGKLDEIDDEINRINSIIDFDLDLKKALHIFGLNELPKNEKEVDEIRNKLLKNEESNEREIEIAYSLIKLEIEKIKELK